MEPLNLFKSDLESAEFFGQVQNLKDINKKFDRGMTLLHISAVYYKIELAEILLKNGINIDEKDNFGNTALWTAVFNAKGKYELVDLLLQHGADPESRNQAGNTPLNFAKTIKDALLIQKLSYKINSKNSSEL